MNETLKKIVILLCEMKWDFEIISLLGITKDKRIISAINPEEIGEDLIAIYTYEGRQEWVISETETERLEDLYKMLKETNLKGYSDIKIRDSEWVKKRKEKNEILQLVNLIRNPLISKDDDRFIKGYIKGHDYLRTEIEKVLRKRGIVRLYDYVIEGQGSIDWEHSTFKLKYHDEIVFILHSNAEVELDNINLIVENEFTSNVRKFFVINRIEKEEEIVIEIY